MKRLLIDTDTGSDDAVALVMAAKHPDVVIEAVTIVAGNVPLQMGVQNALYTFELCNVNVPVYAGCARPMLREPVTAQAVHGQDGMGDLGLPLHGREPDDGHGIDVLIETAKQNKGELTLVTLGPLTNVATALLREPRLAEWICECFVMGGVGDGYGNMTPVAEYNVWCDPEAAQIVFASGMKLTMIGWDISYKYATFNDEDKAAIRAIDTPLAHFVVAIQRVLEAYSKEQNQLAGFDLPDPIAMAIAIDPSIGKSHPYYVEVTIGDGLCRGQTVVDRLHMMGKPPNVHVVMTAERERFLIMLQQSIS